MKELLNIIKDAEQWRDISPEDNSLVVLCERGEVYERPHIIEYETETAEIALYRAKRSWGDICNDADTFNAIRAKFGENKAVTWAAIYYDADLSRQELQKIGGWSVCANR